MSHSFTVLTCLLVLLASAQHALSVSPKLVSWTNCAGANAPASISFTDANVFGSGAFFSGYATFTVSTTVPTSVLFDSGTKANGTDSYALVYDWIPMLRNATDGSHIAPFTALQAGSSYTYVFGQWYVGDEYPAGRFDSTLQVVNANRTTVGCLEVIFDVSDTAASGMKSEL